MADSYKGHCFCGAIEIEATGTPARQGYCHCRDCQSWLAAPVNAYTIWPASAVRVTKGADKLGAFNKTGRVNRRFCTVCGGHLFAELPQINMIDIFANVLEGFPFEPSAHINYGSRTVPMKDGLPKYREFPPPRGSAELMPD